MQFKNSIEENAFDGPDTCPNCGHRVGEESSCSNCGAVIFNDGDELSPFDEDEGDALDF